MGWIQKHITGTPEANERLDAAQEHLESFDGPVEDDEFCRRNDAVGKALDDLPAPRRFGWI